MTLAQQLVNRQKTKSEMIDDGFHRHAFDDKDGLPTWFLDDEVRVQYKRWQSVR
jgi:AdoMet-dependent rRNA methyltransferase SPB1